MSQRTSCGSGLPGTPSVRGYVAALNRSLRPAESVAYSAVDLFAGAGGLSLGFAAAGFAVTGYESDPAAVRTHRRNLGACEAGELTIESEIIPADVLLAGPPCQPWSSRGRQRGTADERDGLDIVLSAVSRVRPRLALIENVPGLAGRGRDVLNSVVTALTKLGYATEWRVLNSADYGVPQARRRLLIVAHEGEFAFPAPLDSRIPSGLAVGRLARHDSREARTVTQRMLKYIERYERKSACRRPRDLDFSRPARTLTVRNLSGATGDMLRVLLPNGKRRMLTVREAARLQSFPDWYRFEGSQVARFTQIGNSVPPLLALHLGRSAKRALDRAATPS